MALVKHVVVALVAGVSCLAGMPAAFADQGTPSAAPAAVEVQVSGTIIDFSPLSLTLRSGGDVRAVRLMPGTKYAVNGQFVASKPLFRYGEQARVLTTREPDGSLNALTVALRTTVTGTRRIAGTIIDFSPGSLTIRTRTTDVFAVRLSASTRYWVNGQPVSSKPEVHYGEHVMAVVQQEQNGSLDALRVRLGSILPPGTRRVAGSIIDFSPISLTIRTATRDVFAVRLTTTTSYSVNGQPVSSRPVFHYLEHAAVLAHREADGSLNALTVHLRTS